MSINFNMGMRNTLLPWDKEYYEYNERYNLGIVSNLINLNAHNYSADEVYGLRSFLFEYLQGYPVKTKIDAKVCINIHATVINEMLNSLINNLSKLVTNLRVVYRPVNSIEHSISLTLDEVNLNCLSILTESGGSCVHIRKGKIVSLIAKNIHAIHLEDSHINIVRLKGVSLIDALSSKIESLRADVIGCDRSRLDIGDVSPAALKEDEVYMKLKIDGELNEVNLNNANIEFDGNINTVFFESRRCNFRTKNFKIISSFINDLASKFYQYGKTKSRGSGYFQEEYVEKIAVFFDVGSSVKLKYSKFKDCDLKITGRSQDRKYLGIVSLQNCSGNSITITDLNLHELTLKSVRCGDLILNGTKARELLCEASTISNFTTGQQGYYDLLVFRNSKFSVAPFLSGGSVGFVNFENCEVENNKGEKFRTDKSMAVGIVNFRHYNLEKVLNAKGNPFEALQFSSKAKLLRTYGVFDKTVVWLNFLINQFGFKPYRPALLVSICPVLSFWINLYLLSLKDLFSETDIQTAVFLAVKVLIPPGALFFPDTEQNRFHDSFDYQIFFHVSLCMINSCLWYMLIMGTRKRLSHT